MDQRVTESLASLRAALSAVQAAYAEIPKGEGEDRYDSAESRLSYMIGCLRRLIKEAWVDSQAFPSVESLAGWPAETVQEAFAQAVKTGIIESVRALRPLAEIEPTTEDKDALQVGINEAIEAAVKMCDDAKSKKKPVVTEGAAVRIVGSTTFVSEGSDPARNQYRMLVIKEGLSGNRNSWKGPTLKASIGLLEGRPIYLNHANGAHGGQPQPRSIADKVGWWSDASYVEGLAVGEQSVNGIVATANLLENSAHPWLTGMIREAISKGQPNIVGVSVDAQVSGSIKRGADKQLFRDIESINAYTSADIVAEPGAGGQPLAVLEGMCSDEEIMELENLTEEQLRETNPDLVDRIVAAAREGYSQPTPAPAPAPAPATEPQADPRVTEALTRLDDVTARLTLREQSLVLEALLVDSGLPDAVRTIVRNEVGQNIMTREAMTAIIDRYVEVSRSVVSESVLTSSTIIPFRGTSVAENQVGPLDQVSAALDAWFGNPDPAMEGKYHPITSIKQFYIDVTGDRTGGIDGMYNAKESVIGRYLGMNVQEALPGATHIIGGSTITLPNLFGTSMNRMLTKKYRAQNLWWEPIVEKTRLDNFKQQDRVRMHSFGSLTERSTGVEEYTELDWNETNETFTPTGYGNVVPVSRRAFINDDMEGLRRIPTLLAESAGYTINEVISALFTANSGNGPTLTDTVQVFNAASHQGNRITSALDRASLTAAIKIGASMNNDAGKRVGWRLRHLLVPIDLADTAFELISSEKAPGSANNEPNFIRSGWGVDNMIVVPQWTDANNWYAMADPSDITNIEVGFILGRQDPEFFIQNMPTEGIVFTNDVINFKVRHEYGADWLDYRGAVASIVV